MKVIRTLIALIAVMFLVMVLEMGVAKALASSAAVYSLNGSD